MKALTTATLTILLAPLLTAAPAVAQVQPLTAWWIDSGDADSTALWCIAPLGDINADGLNDLIVSSASKKLCIYLGNTQPDTVPDLFIPQPADSLMLFGLRMFNVGDVNGDGYSDILAGASNLNTYFYRRYAYLYFGGPALDTLPDVVFRGDSTSPYSTSFADQAGGLGDINGDGFNDFAILDDQYLVNFSSQRWGAVYLYYGGNPPDSIPDIILRADSTFNRIGMHIAPLGDINNDGYADFAMSHPDCQGAQGQPSAGLIAIYYGGNPPDTLPHLVIHGPENTALGRSLTTFDWNGDGQVDIFAGGAMQYPPNYYSSLWEFNVSPAMTGAQPNHVFLGQGGYGACMGW